jgi:hypothetical protein
VLFHPSDPHRTDLVRARTTYTFSLFSPFPLPCSSLIRGKQPQKQAKTCPTPAAQPRARAWGHPFDLFSPFQVGWGEALPGTAKMGYLPPQWGERIYPISIMIANREITAFPVCVYVWRDRLSGSLVEGFTHPSSAGERIEGAFQGCDEPFCNVVYPVIRCEKAGKGSQTARCRHFSHTLFCLCGKSERGFLLAPRDVSPLEGGTCAVTPSTCLPTRS